LSSLITTGGFEIALSFIFTLGIQHIAETPEGMASQKTLSGNK